MALDGIFLNLLSNELKCLAVGTRIEKVHQPTKEEIVLTLRGKTGAGRLLLSARADSPRIHYTKYAPENPQNPPMFCMLMRKRLSGARLVGISQEALERILKLDFDAVNELGDHCIISIIIEIMARHSNIILVDEENRIIDAIKRIDVTMSSVRQVLPGLEYKLPPPQDKMCLLTSTPEEIVFALSAKKNMYISKAIQSVMQGVSPILCREIAYQCCGDDIYVSQAGEDEFSKLRTMIGNIKHIIVESDRSASEYLESDGRTEFEPACGVIVNDQTGKPKDFCFIEIKQYGDTVGRKKYDCLCELLDEFYEERVRIERTRSRSQELLKKLHNMYERTARKINTQTEELKSCQDCEKLRIYGDIISANVHSLGKGLTFYELENFYDENRMVKIPADPALSPAKNAQKYYKEYRKSHTAAKLLVDFIAQEKKELQYLESVLEALERAGSDREVNEIREELYAQGYLKRKKSDGKKQKTAALCRPRSTDRRMALRFS